MIGTDIAIDLGTSRFKVYLDGKGIVVSEPSIIAVDNLTDEVIAKAAELSVEGALPIRNNEFKIQEVRVMVKRFLEGIRK